MPLQHEPPQGNKLGKANANSCPSPSRYETERRGKELTDLGVQVHFFLFFFLSPILRSYFCSSSRFPRQLRLFVCFPTDNFIWPNSNNGEVLSAVIAPRFSTGLRSLAAFRFPSNECFKWQNFISGHQQLALRIRNMVCTNLTRTVPRNLNLFLLWPYIQIDDPSHRANNK